ncbi:cytochrome b N-terminal domain-containing protein [Lusitaniella coriacea]|uniref:cytochrome b N-terminal domain-containing protein n=1 Tax=Lusitaniella coriacea TaxID=1983105 RepID=UPI003CF84EE4
MNKDVQFAGKIGQLASHFPQEWQEYQDWLGDIIAARDVLAERYPAWQVALIFRWRLFYFVTYLASLILLNWLKHLLFESKDLNKKTLSEMDGTMTQSSYRYILQRAATLLAVAELTLCGIAALTGIMLAFYYQPTAMGAYQSLETIAREVANGSLILSLHNIAGNALIIVALIQIIVLFLGREFLLSWFAGWISGILLTLTAIGLSWTAIVLTWEQTSFWRFKVELSTVASIPLVGSLLRNILSGGGGINSSTLQHMYALHSYILAIAAILLSIAHLVALIFQEQSWKSFETLQGKQGGESTPNSDSLSV